VDLSWSPFLPVGHTLYSWGQNQEEYDRSSLSLEGLGLDLSISSLHSLSTSVREPFPASDSKCSIPATHTPTLSGNTQLAQLPKSESAKDKQEKRTKVKVEESESMKKEGGGKKGVKEKAKKESNEEAAVSSGSLFSRLDIRVGKILKAWKHPKADSLYVENIDIGEEKPREIVSGLLQFYSIQELEGSLVLVITNLLPQPLRDVMSYGMVLAASVVLNEVDSTGKPKKVVQLIRPPADSKPGQRVSLQNEDCGSAPTDKNVNPKKQGGLWSQVVVDLRTNDQCVATYKSIPLITTVHPSALCTAASLNNAQIG